MSLYLLLALLSLEAILPAEGCSCLSKHLQRSFCGPSAAVLTVKFLSVNSSEESNQFSNYTVITYGIDRLQVYKGGAEIKNLKYIYSSTEYGCEFTISPSDTEYLVAGPFRGGRLQLIYCDYIAPWYKLSACEIKGIEGAYKKGCDCNVPAYLTLAVPPGSDYQKENQILRPHTVTGKVLSCDFGQCGAVATTDDCKFNEPHPNATSNAAPRSDNTPEKNMVCARSETGTCTWQPIGEC